MCGVTWFTLWPCLFSVIDCVAVSCYVGAFWACIAGFCALLVYVALFGFRFEFSVFVLFWFWVGVDCGLLFTVSLIVLIITIVLIGYYFGLYAGVWLPFVGFCLLFSWVFWGVLLMICWRRFDIMLFGLAGACLVVGCLLLRFTCSLGMRFG